MKALTLKHPWPYAICRLGKDVENRTWSPGHRLPIDSWFAIHGGVPPRGESYEEFADDLETLDAMFPRACPASETILSGIVAVCRFGGTITNWCSSIWFNGPIGWHLAETVVLPEPVPCKGQQGLWDLPEDVLRRVRLGFTLAREQQEAKP